MKRYFKTKKVKNIEELLIEGFSTDSGYFQLTYKNPKYTIQECHSARRSFGDLLAICKTYFPKTTKEELAKTLVILNKKIRLICLYCPNISKLVFLISKNEYKLPFNCHIKGEEHIKGCGKYSFNDILNLSKC